MMTDILTNRYGDILTFCASENVFGTNSYCVACGSNAFLVDPVLSNNYETLISSYHIDMAIITHEHFDHIRGVNDLKKRYNIPIFCGEKAKTGLSDPAINMSRYADYLISIIPFGDHDITPNEYICYADYELFDGQIIKWKGHKLKIKSTPGHSNGSIAIIVDDEFMFSGDIVFKDYPTATRMPGGSSRKFNLVTKPWLESISQEMIIYPGHNKPFVLKERYLER